MNRAHVVPLALMIVISLAACGRAAVPPTPTATPRVTDTPPPTDTPTPAVTDTPVLTPTLGPFPVGQQESSSDSSGSSVSTDSGGSSGSSGSSGVAQASSEEGAGDGMPTAAPANVGRSCPDGKEFDPTKGICVNVTDIDCGPNPYNFNQAGGHWERPFYEVCWWANGDDFERLFPGMTYAEASAVLTSKGLDGLSHAEQVAALDAEGYQGSALGVIPYCPVGFEYNPNLGACVGDAPPDCGPNPYKFNDILGLWEREFNKWCYATTNDPFEIIFHKMILPRVQGNLEAVGLGGLSHAEQVDGLEALGYWDSSIQNVPEGGPRFE